MNLMGKILTFFILIMSISFLFLAIMVGASHRNWKDQALENKQKATLAQKLLQDAKDAAGEKDRALQNEKVTRQQQLQQLFSQLTIEKQNRDAKEKELTEQLVIAQDQLESLKSAEARLTQQDREVESLKQSNKQLVDEIAQKRTQIVALTNQLNENQASLEILEARAQDLSSSLAQSEKVMRKFGLNANSLVDHIPPKIEAVVVQVKDEFVVVKIGSDDGLREGHTLDIYRGNRFIGKATVSKTDHDMSVLQVIPGYLQAAVIEGDYVTTKF